MEPEPRVRLDPEQLHTERLSMLGGLVAGVIHELNNPLMVVSANLQVLEDYVAQQAQLLGMYARGERPEAIGAYQAEIDWAYVEADLPRVLEGCQEGAKRALALVDELRRFSRRGATTEIGPVDLKGCVQSTVRLLNTRYKHQVSFEVDFEALPPVIGCTGQIQQVIMNLLANACQAIAARGHVRVKGRRKGERVVIAVSDDGAGIPESVRPHIFEPYFTTKGAAEGTGLGLAIVQRIVERHGGTITVDSQEGAGTTFMVELPIEGPSEGLDPSAPYVW